MGGELQGSQNLRRRLVCVVALAITVLGCGAQLAHADTMATDPFRRTTVESDPFRRAGAEFDPFRRGCVADADPFRRNAQTNPFRRSSESDPFRRNECGGNSRCSDPFRRNGVRSDPFRRSSESDPFRRNNCNGGGNCSDPFRRNSVTSDPFRRANDSDPFRRNTCGTAANQMIVVLVNGADPAAAAARYGISPTATYTDGLVGYSAVLTDAQLEAVLADAETAWVETGDSTFQIETTPVAEGGVSTQFASTAVQRVGALASRSAAIDGIDSRVNIDIAILDSGIDSSHPDLNVVGGKNCTSRDPSYDDTDGHGTMVAGFAGAIDNSVGRVGVAPGARLWGVKVADSNGMISNRDLLCALNWVAKNSDTIDVVNMSFGGFEPADLADCPTTTAVRKHKRVRGIKGGSMSAIRAALCTLNERGVVLVASAGNDGKDASIYVPAAFSEVIAVSALADQDGLAGGLGGAFSCLTGEIDDSFATFSNFGSKIDIAAPGVCVSSTFEGGHYAIASGTSFSAPQVAGAAALLKAGNPRMTPAQVVQRIQAAGEPMKTGGTAHPERLLNVSTF